MEERKVHNIPAISCGHCVMAIKREIGKMEGVAGVEGTVEAKIVTIRWESPATWEKITRILTKIGYPAAH